MALGQRVGEMSDSILNTARRILTVCIANGLWVRSWKFGDLSGKGRPKPPIRTRKLLGVKKWKTSVAQVSIMFHSADGRHFAASQTVDQRYHLMELGQRRNVPPGVGDVTRWEMREVLFDGTSLEDLLQAIRGVGSADHVAVDEAL
jgi:hypothetical protein